MAKVQSVKNISGETIYPKTIADAVMYDSTKTMGALAGTSVYINSESSTVTELGDPIDANSLGGHEVDYFATKSDVNTINQKIESMAASTAAMISAIDDFGADTDAVVNTHNVSTSAHNDIRVVINELTARLNALANSDDITLDQMAEIVTYIKNNHDVIDGVTTSKVNVSDIINDLITNVSNKPLSAAQGVVLKALIDAIPTWAKQTSKPSYTATEVGALKIGGTNGMVAPYDGDLNDIAETSIFNVSGSAPNNPSGGWGFVLSMVHTHGTGYITQYYFPMFENNATYYRIKYNGVWGEWIQMYTTVNKPTATDVGALPIIGGTLSGNLLISEGWGQLFSDWGTAVLASLQTPGEVNKNQRSLAVSNKKYKDNLSESVFVQEIIDGVPGPEYRLYGEHNKPTAADVGALPADGNANSATKLQTARNINGVEFDGSKDVTVYSPYDRPRLAKQLTSAGWYRVAEGSVSSMSFNMVIHKSYDHLSPAIALLSIDINYISSTANIVQLNSSFSSSSIPKIRVNKLNGDYCIEFYFNGSTVAESVYIDFFNIHGTGTLSTVDFAPGAIPTDHTTTEFAISQNPMKASVFEGNLKGIAGHVECPSVEGDVLAYALSCPANTVTSFRWGTTATNAPSTWCNAMAIRSGSGDCTIIAFGTMSAEMYTNMASNGIWKGWKKATMTAI